VTIDLLDGKVRVSDLRETDSAHTTQAADRNTFWAADSRGVASVFLRQSVSIQCAEHVSSAAGSVRGNHVHWEATEHLFITTGEVRLYVEDVKAGRREDIHLKAGALVVMRPGIAHAIVALTESTLISIAEGADSLIDRERHVLLPTDTSGFIIEQPRRQ
jgi:dTDP-4-dehydrorhamnose 3,5-epimerase-like enzyme